MPREFDPTVKVLVETSPADWLALDGLPPAPVTDISAEITAVLSGAADRFLRVDAAEPYVLHLDFQSGHDSASLPPRLQLYNAGGAYRTGLPVRSVAVILRPEADSPRLTGVLKRTLPGKRRPYEVFEYGVLRVWRIPAERLIRGGPGTLPLAPIAAVSEADLPGVIRVIERRLRGEAKRRELWSATRILMGLRYPAGLVDVLLQGITEMRESTTYQAIIAEGEALGRAEEARRLLLLVGERHLGAPDQAARVAVGALTDVERVEDLVARAHEAEDWRQLLGLKAPRRRGGRREA